MASGGWYCSKCGRVYSALPSGLVTCECGTLGLRGYEGKRPVRIDCPVEECTRRVWRDGVNPGELQHKWEHEDYAARMRDLTIDAKP